METVVRTAHSTYVFRTGKDGRTEFCRNFMEEGIVDGKVIIELGEALNFNYHSLNPYTYSESDDLSRITSTTVQSVEIL